MSKNSINKYYRDKLKKILEELKEIEDHVTKDLAKGVFRSKLSNEMIKINVEEIKTLIELIKKRLEFITPEI